MFSLILCALRFTTLCPPGPPRNFDNRWLIVPYTGLVQTLRLAIAEGARSSYGGLGAHLEVQSRPDLWTARNHAGQPGWVSLSLRVLCNNAFVDSQIIPKMQASVSDLSHVIYRHQKRPVRTDAIATRPTSVPNLAFRVFEDGDDVSEDARNEKITELPAQTRRYLHRETRHAS